MGSLSNGIRNVPFAVNLTLFMNNVLFINVFIYENNNITYFKDEYIYIFKPVSYKIKSFATSSWNLKKCVMYQSETRQLHS